MTGRISLEQDRRGNLEYQWGRNLYWSGQIEFRTLDPEMSAKPPPFFMKEGSAFPGDDVEIVVKGTHGSLIRDKNREGYIVAPTKELDWIVRPRIDRMVKVVFAKEHFLTKDAFYDALVLAASMSGGKSTFLRETAEQGAEQGMMVLLIRPRRARKVDRHKELLGKYPDLIIFEDIESIDEVMKVINRHNPDLVVWDEMNLLIFAPSKTHTTPEEKAKAIVEATEAIVESGKKFAGALLHRYATGEAFPPINEIIALEKKNPRIELFKMNAQCLCGANAEVQAMTEVWCWQGEFVDGGKCLVRPLVPIDEEREAIENFYAPLCPRCHHLIHGELAPRKWAVLDFSTARDFTTVDLFRREG